MKRILAILMILILLTCNVGLTYAVHYCGGRAVESAWSLGKTNLDCGMGDMDADPLNTNDTSRPWIDVEGCCDNSYNSLSIEDDFGIQEIDSSTACVTMPMMAVFFLPRIAQRTSVHFFVDYAPPWKEMNIPVLFQAFLI